MGRSGKLVGSGHRREFRRERRRRAPSAPSRDTDGLAVWTLTAARLGGDREANLQRRASSGRTREIERSAVAGDKVQADGKAETGSARWIACRVERHERLSADV